MKKLSLTYKIIFLLNNIFAVLLLISFVLPYIKPSSFPIASVLSLTTPFIIFINILFVLFWILVGFKKQFLLSTIILIISLFILPSIYEYNFDSVKEKEKSISIMSYNVRKFNIYKWIDDKKIPQKISAFIEKENPDVVTLQEFKKNKDFHLNYPYQYNHRNYNWNRKFSYPSGLAFFSKYPIINKGVVKYRKVFTSIVYIDIVKNKDTFRIYNLHLESLGVVPDEDYFGHKDSEGLIKRLNKSFKVQQIEIDTLNSNIRNCNYKFIITGDMNNTPYSWAYKNLKNNLKDSFLEAGSGFGKTYTFKGFPLRIDYIFTDKDLNINQHRNYDVKYSDHYPIMATVEF